MAKSNFKLTNGLCIPAVGYIRMSTGRQEHSPERQRAEIIKLAKREGYRIIRWYEDHNISGAKTLKRKQFQQMIRDAESGDFKAILCWDQDRFGRFDSIEAGEWISPLRRAGVALVSVVQGHIDWEDFAGRMMYQITQEGKHRYLVDLSKNVLRGMIRFAQQGHLLGYQQLQCGPETLLGSRLGLGDIDSRFEGARIARIDAHCVDGGIRPHTPDQSQSGAGPLTTTMAGSRKGNENGSSRICKSSIWTMMRPSAPPN